MVSVSSVGDNHRKSGFLLYERKGSTYCTSESRSPTVGPWLTVGNSWTSRLGGEISRGGPDTVLLKQYSRSRWSFETNVRAGVQDRAKLIFKPVRLPWSQASTTSRAKLFDRRMPWVHEAYVVTKSTLEHQRPHLSFKHFRTIFSARH